MKSLDMRSLEDLFEWLWEKTCVPKVVGQNPDALYWMDITFFTYFFSNYVMHQCKNSAWAVVVVQFIERLLPTPEVRGLRPVISNFYIEHNCIENTKVKKKRPQIGPVLQKNVQELVIFCPSDKMQQNLFPQKEAYGCNV